MWSDPSKQGTKKYNMASESKNGRQVPSTNPFHVIVNPEYQ